MQSNSTYGELYGGVDGGATSSTAVIITDSGDILATVHGESTQLWLVGIEESSRRIKSMFELCFKAGKLPLNTCLKSVGCCISGSEQEARNLEFAKTLEQHCGEISQKFVIKNDTYSPVSAVSPSGGIVMISGTGSNCQYISKNYDIRCGGWGHLLGEEASAYWIAKTAMKYVFDDEDAYKKSPHSSEPVRKKLFEHFGVVNRFEILDFFYGSPGFDKSFVAKFCITLSLLARNENDKLSRHIFTEAGKSIAMHITALLAQNNILSNISHNCIKVVCVGSVFKSWDLMKDGFENYLTHCMIKGIEIKLVKLTKSIALGAAILGASYVNGCKDINYDDNYEVFYDINL